MKGKYGEIYYEEGAYSIQKGDLRWIFVHPCPEKQHMRLWDDNKRDLKCCDNCNAPIPDRLILLWSLLDKEEFFFPPIRKAINPSLDEYP